MSDMDVVQDVDVLASEIQALQSEHEALCERVAAKRDTLATIRASIAGVVGELVDADAKTRPGLVRRHTELRAEADACAAELAELCRRRDRASLARYELAEAKAKAEAGEALAAVRLAKAALDAAIDDHRKAENYGFVHKAELVADDARAAYRRRLAEMEIATVRLKVEHDLARVAYERAGRALVQSRDDAAAAREATLGRDGALPDSSGLRAFAHSA